MDPGRRAFLLGRKTEPLVMPPGMAARVIEIGDACLTLHGIVCQSCADQCGAAAIRLRLRIGGPALPAVDLLSCTGCGECVARCPGQAITLVDRTTVAADV